MRIVQVLFSGLGGQAAVAFSISESDQLKANEYSFAFYGDEKIKQDYINRCEESKYNYLEIHKKTGIDIIAVKNYIKYLYKEKPETILLHSTNLIIPSLFYQIFFKTKIIVVEHNPNALKTKFQWISSFISQLFANHVVYLTQIYFDEIKRANPFRMPVKRIQIIPNGIDILVYKPTEKRNKVSYIQFGTVSRLTKEKNHIIVLKALKYMMDTYNFSNFKYLIAGTGDYESEIKRAVIQLELECYVEFVGNINHSDLPSFFNDLDLYIHPSQFETLSMSILEAMACRKAIVASDVSGINNLLKHKDNSLLFSAEDPIKLAQIILYLLNNNTEIHRLGDRALADAELYHTQKIMFERYQKLIN